MNYDPNQNRQNSDPYGTPPYFDPSQNGYTAPFINQKPPVPQGFGVASLIFGITSLVCCCCCVGLPLLFAIAAIVFACLDRAKAGMFRGLAMTGLILGILGTLIGVAELAYVAFAFNSLDLNALIDAYYEGMETGDFSKYEDLLAQYGAL